MPHVIVSTCVHIHVHVHYMYMYMVFSKVHVQCTYNPVTVAIL